MRSLLLLFVLSASSVQGQGTLNFNNRLTTAGINAPVTYEGAGLLGPDYLGQLFLFDGASYEPVGSAVAFQSNVLLAGYVNGGVVTVSTVAPGQEATLVLRAWNASAGGDWLSASSSAGLVWGQSDSVTVRLGGGGSPPSLPANLDGLQGFGLSADSVAPVVVSQPAGAQVNEGGGVELGVTAAGLQPLFYQWLKDGVEIPGAIGSTLLLEAAGVADDGVYEVVVSNDYGSVTSVPALLTVMSPLRIYADGVEVVGNAGGVDEVWIALSGPHPSWSMYYTLDGSPVSSASIPYTGSFSVNSNVEIRVAAYSPDFAQIVEVNPLLVRMMRTQSISWGDISGLTYGDTVSLSAAASSGLPVSFRVISGPGVVSGAELSATGVGVVVLQATQAGSDTFVAVSMERSVEVGRAVQHLEFGSAGVLRYGDSGVSLSASSSAGLAPFSFSVVSGPGTVQGNQLTPTGVGEVVVRASQAGDTHYLPASVEQSLTVQKGVPTIDWDSVGTLYFPGDSVALGGASSSGLPVSFEVVSGPASVAGGQLSVMGAGSIVLRAVQDGNELWERVEIEQTVEVVGLTTLTIDAVLGGLVHVEPLKDYYLPTDVVRLTAEPGNGFAFGGWQGDAGGSVNPLELVMTQDLAVSSSFDDVAAPLIVLDSPVAGSTPDHIVKLSGLVEDNLEVVGAYWELDGVLQGDLNLSENHFGVLEVALRRGENRVRVVATDAAGNENAEEVLVSWNPLQTLRLVSPAAVQEGQKVIIPIELETQGDMGGMQFVVEYDEAYLKEPVVHWGWEVEGSDPLVSSDVPGRVQLEFDLSGASLPSGLVTLGNIEFWTRSVPHTLDTRLSGVVSAIVDAEGEAITTSVYTEPGDVTIDERVYLADNNANQRLDVGDSALIQSLVSGLAEMRSWDISRNDLTGDGVLDEADVLEVFRTVVGIHPQPGVDGGDPTVDNTIQMVLEADKKRLRTGETVTVEVKLEGVNGGDIFGASFRLDYDPQALWLVDVNSHVLATSLPLDVMGLWNVFPAESDYSLQSGTIAMAASSGTAWDLRDDLVATLTFEVQPGMAGAALWPMTLSSGEVAVAGFDTVLTAPSKLEFRGLAPEFHAGESALGEGVFQMVFEGADQHSYVVEAASSIQGPWVTISRGLTTEAAAIQFIEDAVGGSRFYRIRLVE
ncbi:MAG: cohesin domain-containing protein [Limisphaerales bacterium]